MNEGKFFYLGDGAYVEDEGYQFRLFTERTNGVHEIYLDGPTLSALLGYIAAKRDLTITVTVNRIGTAE